MHWTYGIGCLIVVMVVMYLFIRGAQEPDLDVPPKMDAYWRCNRCSMMLAADHGEEVVLCPHTARAYIGPCPMELIGEDGKVARDDES